VSTDAAIHVFVSGRVQGVGFRFFVRAKASAYGLDGFVRNLPDGRVEVVAAGEEPVLKGFIEDLQEGPPGSSVRECRVDWLSSAAGYEGFSIEL
jgi:acylphosphatase